MTATPLFRRRTTLAAGLAGAAAVAVGGVAALRGGGGVAVRLRPGWQVIAPPHDVTALAERGDTILAGGRDGLFSFDRDSARAVPLPGEVPEMDYVKAILVDDAGRLWVGHRRGLALERDGVWQVFAADPASPPGPVAALAIAPDGRLLAGGEAGLALADAQGFVPGGGVDLPQAAGGQVSSLLVDRQGRLWVGLAGIGGGGLLLRGGDGWQVFGTDQGLAHPAVNALFEDAAGTLHVATGFADRGGACRQVAPGDPGAWACIGAADGLAADMARLVFADRHGQVWYGTEFSGAAVLRDGRALRIGTADGLPGAELKAMVQDSAGNLWLGTDGGLVRIAAGQTLLPDLAQGQAT